MVNLRHTLAELEPGQAGTVKVLHHTGLERRRLMDLGVVPGTSITAEMRSPLGDPVAYRVRGALIALRTEQAALVELNTDNAAEKDVSA